MLYAGPKDTRVPLVHKYTHMYCTNYLINSSLDGLHLNML